MVDKKEILTVALEQLELQTGIKAKGIRLKRVPANYDAALVLEGIHYVVGIKKDVLKRNIGAIINQMTTPADPGEALLAADYINDRLGKTLRDAGINYIDTVGNAYLNKKPLFVLIKGNKTPREPLNTTAQVFTPNGLKVIFALITHPDLVRIGTQREIAKYANIALGAVGAIIKDLINQGYLQKRFANNERYWNKPQLPRLLEKWAEEYPKLRRKLFLGRYTAQDDQWWKNHGLRRLAPSLGVKLLVPNIPSI